MTVRLYLFWFSFLIFGLGIARSQQKAEQWVELHTGAISSASTLWQSTGSAGARLSNSDTFTPFLGIARFERHPDDDAKALLEQHGIYLQHYIPDRAWLAVVVKPVALHALSTTGLAGILELTPDLKVDSTLLAGRVSAFASKSAGMADIWIRSPRFFPVDSVAKWLMAENLTLLSEELKLFGVFPVRTPTENIRHLAGLHFVEFIQEAPAPDGPENTVSPINSRANMLRSAYGPLASGLSGQGVVIGIGDESDPLRHIDFTGRLINRYPHYNVTDHGLHTMGTLAGAGIVREELAGYAPRSTIVSQYFSNILSASPRYYQDFGMRLTNNSYGSTGTSDLSYRRYDLFSALLDQMAIDLPDLLHVFAAGNSGNSVISGTPFSPAVTGQTGFGTILASYQSAKNTLVAGNISATYARSATSSRGPVSGGRVKPDVMALGASVRSANGINDYGVRSGTSMAAPAVTGGAALLTEQYKSQFPAAGHPHGSLLKALICNGAADLGNAGPDYSFGYGAMNLYRSSEMLKNEHFQEGTVTTGITNTGTITVPPNTAALKVMLYWADAPATPLAANPLVNDLDLSLTVGGNTLLPFVNNPDPASVSNPAVTAVDRANNIEQVVMLAPSPGTVGYSVNGFSVPAGPQKYVLVYDIIPEGTTITSPVGGEKYVPGDQVAIHWDSYGPATTFHLDYYNGASWVRIVSNLAATTRQRNWTIPAGLTTPSARVRVVRVTDDQTSESADFNVLGRPTVTLADESLQCEGHIGLNWTAVSGATGYEIMKLNGSEMEVVASVSSTETTYNIPGLSIDSTYWVSVRAVLSDSPGLRSVAVSRRPNSGNCQSPIFDGDLAIVQMTAPVQSGRLFTSSALSSSQALSFRIKNRSGSTSPAKPAVVSFQMNNAPAVLENVNLPAIPPGGEHQVVFTGTVNMSAAGTYWIQMTLDVADDPFLFNNQVTTTVSQLANPPVTFTNSGGTSQFVENLETLTDSTYFSSHYGLSGQSRFDFESSDASGRLRSFVNSDLTYSGNRAITLDSYGYPQTYTESFLIGTYNLSSYNRDVDDIRLDFWFIEHGQLESDQNNVWIRGSDGSPWISVFDMFAAKDPDGEYRQSASVEISKVLKTAGQQFSTSTQVRWGQGGTYQAAGANAINGITLDDIRLYRASQDVQIKALTAPSGLSCNLGNQEQVSVLVYNSSKSTLTNVPVSYRVNSGTTVSETIASLPPETEVSYTFTTRANLSSFQQYAIRTWVTHAADNVPQNNELTTFITNSPVIATFPYLETFEQNNGNWYTGGSLSSWDYGTPASTRISRAASGTRAWKTRLRGNHNDRELSYLYSPCIQIGNLTSPALSFMMALDIEDCGKTAPCDLAWAEYSFDGANWQVLGAAGQGTNWYNKSFSSGDGWAQPSYHRWHVASIDLPVPPSSSGGRILLRFVMRSDVFRNREGLAIDDIHIYDKAHVISSDNAMIPAVVQTVSAGNAWSEFVSDNRILAALNPGGPTSPGSTTVRSYQYSGAVRHTDQTYYLNRSFVIQPNNSPLDAAAKVRLYFSDSETEALVSATGCAGCAGSSSVLGLGISKFSSNNKATENNTIADNTGAGWDYIPAAEVSKVPYDKGYYVEFATTHFSEFWLSPGPMLTSDPLPVRLLDFRANAVESQVLLDWSASEMTAFGYFEIQRAVGNEALKMGQFESLARVYPESKNQQRFRYTDASTASGILYYRLKMVDLDGSYVFSDLRSVMTGAEPSPIIYPNPSHNGVFFLGYQASENTRYVVRDVLGKILNENVLPGSSFPEKAVIDLRTLPPGIYFVEVLGKQKQDTFKLVKL